MVRTSSPFMYSLICSNSWVWPIRLIFFQPKFGQTITGGQKSYCCIWIMEGYTGTNWSFWNTYFLLMMRRGEEVKQSNCQKHIRHVPQAARNIQNNGVLLSAIESYVQNPFLELNGQFINNGNFRFKRIF